MNIILWILGIAAILAVAFFVIVFGNMIFISQITQAKVKLSPEYTSIAEGVVIEELPYDAAPLDWEQPDSGDYPGAKEMLLLDDGKIEEGRRVFDDDPGKEVLVAFNPLRNDAWVFIANEVFEYADGRLGKSVGAFPDPGFSYIDYVLPVNERFMIVDGRMAQSPYPSERRLWQVAYQGLDKTLLSEKPYYTFDRPPKIFAFDQGTEHMLVYYIGDFSFAFGGDSSRPEFSVLRLFNARHPEGIELIKIGFKAGTVIGVEKIDDGYVVITDPSLPAMADQQRQPPRKWKITLHESL